MPSALAARSSAWTTSFDTVKREKLFRNPPSDTSAYPTLQEAVKPHIDSWNAVFEEGGLLDLALKDIGVKTVFDRLESQVEPGQGWGNKLSSMSLTQQGKPTRDPWMASEEMK